MDTTQTRAHEALTTRSEIGTWVRGSSFEDYLKAHLGEAGLSSHMRGDNATRSFADALLRQWEQGAIFLATNSTRAAIASAAAASGDLVLPGIQPFNLTARQGVVIFPDPIYTLSESGEKRGVAAISWSPCFVNNQTPGVIITAWSRRSDPEDTLAQALANTVDETRQLIIESEEELRLASAARRHGHESATEELGIFALNLEQQKRALIADSRQHIARMKAMPDYLPINFRPLALQEEIYTRADKSISMDFAEVGTRRGDTDAHLASFATRAITALWEMSRPRDFETGEGTVIVEAPVELHQKTVKKFSKKRLACEVSSLHVKDIPDDADRLFVTRQVAKKKSGDFEWTGCEWTARQPITS